MYVIFFDIVVLAFIVVLISAKHMFSLSPAVLKILVYPKLTTFENYY